MKYILKKGSPIFRSHSGLAQLWYGFKIKDSANTVSRIERNFAAIWTNPLVPLGLFVGHLYLIALFLRNPFQKVDLE